MKLALQHAAWAALVTLVLAAPASAQLVSRGNDWNHGTTLNVFAGAGIDAAETRPLVGTSVGWEITPAFAIEGSGYWLDRRGSSDAFAAALKLQAAVMLPHTAVPFVEAGVGLYRVSFGPSASEIPVFYRGRMAMSGTGPGTTNTFMDPAFVLGGGLNVFVTRHVAIRPDVEAMIVRRNSQNYLVTAIAVHIAYHFESHPVTPATLPPR